MVACLTRFVPFIPLFPSFVELLRQSSLPFALTFPRTAFKSHSLPSVTMHFLQLAGRLATALSLVGLSTAIPLTKDSLPEKRASVIKPKVFLIDMFGPEAEVWYGIPEFDLLAKNITVVGLSPLFPEIHCTKDDSVCQVVTGESEINAATTIASLVKSPKFDLTTTYFMIAGIAGVNPKVATLGSVGFAKYAVQVALQYEFDSREIPANFSTGYVPLGATSPSGYPQQ